MGPLTLIPILGLAFFFERRWRLSSAVALLHAVAWIVVALYVGGLIGALWWTALGIHLVGVGALGYELLHWTKRSGRVSVRVPYLMLVALSAAFWLVHGHNEYFVYDEYAHWGIFLKDMLAFDEFWRADTNAMHPRYPPGATLWQYLFSAFQDPTDGKAYLAHFVLLSAPLMVLWSRLSWRQLPWTLGLVALCALVLMNFGLGVSTLYVDHVMSVWFVGTLLCYVSDSEVSWRRTAPYVAALIVLTLLKAAGLAFALTAAGIMAALTLRRAWTQHSSVRSSVLAGAATLVVLAAPAAVAAGTWVWNRDRAGAAEDDQAVRGLVAGLGRIAARGETATEREIGRRFAEVFFDQQISNDSFSWDFNAYNYEMRDRFTERYRLSAFGLFVAYIAWWLALLAFVLRGAARWTWGIIAVGTLGSATGYLVMLYSSYLFAFGNRGLELSSYMRYVQTIALPMVLISFAPLLPAFRTPEQGPAVRWRQIRISASAALFSGALITLYAFEPPYLGPLLEPGPQVALRRDFESLAAEVRRAVGSAPVWIYAPQDRKNEFFGHLLQFLLAPTPASVERSEDFLDQDFATVVARWSRFEYVWIPMPLPPVNAESLSRFVPGSPIAGLFRVRRDAAPGQALEPLVAVAAGAGTVGESP